MKTIFLLLLLAAAPAFAGQYDSDPRPDEPNWRSSLRNKDAVAIDSALHWIADDCWALREMDRLDAKCQDHAVIDGIRTAWKARLMADHAHLGRLLSRHCPTLAPPQIEQPPIPDAPPLQEPQLSTITEGQEF